MCVLERERESIRTLQSFSLVSLKILIMLTKDKGKDDDNVDDDDDGEEIQS